jgi:threonine/homoserine/homoserine lactone efflux protein
LENEIGYILSGIVFGLSGGFTPGPLMTLLISETLKHGMKEGLKIALVPLISDAPIVSGSLLLLSRFSDASLFLGVLALAGAGYLVYLGWEGLRFQGNIPEAGKLQPRSFRKGIITNFLNPNPYIFWITIGAPTVIHARGVGLTASVLFIVFMYVCLVGSTILMAIVAGKSRNFLKSRGYRITIRTLGALLILFALIFVRQGLQAIF